VHISCILKKVDFFLSKCILILKKKGLSDRII
jgi:hypothetical protein